MFEIQYRITQADDGRMIKRVIRSLGVSHHQFQRLKAASALLLDGESVHANHIVHTGQVVLLRLSDDLSRSAAPDARPVRVLYEDDDYLIVDKDAPLACQSSPRQPQNTLENRLSYRFGAGYVFRPVNRLDKGTSGLMVVAKHPHAQMLLSRQLHTDTFVREYMAIVVGEMTGEGVIDQPIRKKDGATICREVHADGRPSITHYSVLSAHNGLSLVRLRLETGRTHQIRVHMQSIGHSVLGDFLYGTEDARLPGRFALHAWHVSFIHPITGAIVECFSPLPEALAALIQTDETVEKIDDAGCIQRSATLP